MDFLYEDNIVKKRTLCSASRIAVGVDEAGCGCLAGPVLAVALIITKRDAILGIGLNDSKKISAKKRSQLYDIIYRHSIFCVGSATVQEIDEHNILRASIFAMERAIQGLELCTATGKILLVDGIQRLNLLYTAHYLPKGDALCPSIAAASIIAKVTRDKIMDDLHATDPSYFWNLNKGYGTMKHLAALRENGPSIHHRKSFKPVQEVINMPGTGDIDV